MPKKSTPAFEVHRSPVHGNGVFAVRTIAPGERIVEYKGRRIGWDEATARAERSGQPVNYTLFFTLADGNVIDGGDHGNDARFINHSCEPNCEAYEEDGRVYIHALREIAPGEELNYNYALEYDGPRTAAIKKAFACHCGSEHCKGVMLAPKKRATRARAAA